MKRWIAELKPKNNNMGVSKGGRLFSLPTYQRS